ncbi:RloB family protein [Halobacillus sp. H74]|uniref:RloB family protein n=1 Tax=Halobacillus sp. H74 TaxID=3457436 RepID=UPI003FCCC45D
MPLPRRKRKGLKQKDTILIVCEGEKTEKLYFEGLKQLLNSPNVKVKVFGTGKSCMKLLDHAIKKYETMKKDAEKIWIVFDKDDIRREEIEKTLKNARENGINYAFSNECFELWLLLHYERVERHIGRAVLYEKMSKYTGYNNYEKNKGNPDMIDKVLPFWDSAVENSKELFDDQKDLFKNPFSNVHMLVEDLKK